jgi:hypothetical protein
VVIDSSIDRRNWIPQVAHGVAQYFIDHPDEARRWHQNGNTIVCLSATDGDHLQDILSRSIGCVSTFSEPDMGDRMTVVVLEDVNGRLLRKLKLITP